MGIFSRNAASENAYGAKTIVAVGCEIRGELACPGNIHIDGIVDGRLQVEQSVTVGKEGRFLGNARTDQLFLSGEFIGQAHCRQLVILPGGRYRGELICESLNIEEGGRFEGNCVYQPFHLPTEIEDKVALTSDRNADNAALLKNPA